MQEQFEGKISYSQEGEDVLLERILGDIDYKGSYIDIGAHHPIRFSNTYKFYQAGWRGINIEATPGSSEVFYEIRPLDINIEIPVSDKEEELTFYVFNHPELNTFSEEHALHWDSRADNRIIDRLKLKTTTIGAILREHAQEKKNFDFLSIDVEGLDLRILKTLDFDEYSFNFIIVEDSPEILDITDGQLYEFLGSKGYKFLSKLFYSSIYYIDYSSDNGRKIFEQLSIRIDPKILNRSPFVCRMIECANEIKNSVPDNESFIFIDADQFQTSGEFAGRSAIPFLEKNGVYWGPPIDDATAIEEIKRQREKGTTFIIFVWPGFWLLDFYKGMYEYIKTNSECLLQNDHIVIFNFNKS